VVPSQGWGEIGSNQSKGTDDTTLTNMQMGSSSQGNTSSESKKLDTPKVDTTRTNTQSGSSSQGNDSTDSKKVDTTLTNAKPESSEGSPNIEAPTPFQRRNPSFDPDEEIGDDDDDGVGKQSGPNLHVIARAIMPLVKQMLSVERERRSFR
jgi:hypothetical protein